MTRHKIWYKDDFFGNGVWRIDMDPNVVEIKEEPLYVVWNYNHYDGPLGTIDDIQILDGEITGELHLDSLKIRDAKYMQSVEVLLDNEDVRLGGYYLDVIKDEAGKNILSCTLREVSVIMTGANPSYKRL